MKKCKLCLWENHTVLSYQERLIITDAHYPVKSSYKTHPALKSGISLRDFPCCKQQVAMQLPGADSRPEEKICTSHTMEPVQKLGWLLRVLMPSKAAFNLQFSHTGHVSCWVSGRVGRRFLRLSSCLEQGNELCPALQQPWLSEGFMQIISMAVNSGKWTVGGKSAVWYWRLRSWYCHSDTAVLISTHFWMLC